MSQWCIFPCFRFPLPEKIVVFYLPKFLMTFLVFDSKFRTFSVSALFKHSPYFRINQFSPTFLNFPLFSFNFCVFCIIYVLFFFPLFWSWCIYASRNTRTGRLCSCIHAYIVLHAYWPTCILAYTHTNILICICAVLGVTRYKSNALL